LASDPTVHSFVYFTLYVIVSRVLNGAGKDNSGPTNGITLSLLMSLGTVCRPMMVTDVMNIENFNLRSKDIPPLLMELGMVWGAISYGSRSPLTFVERSLNVNRYVENISEPVLVPYLNRLQNPTFQQDNTHPLTAAITTDFFARIQVTALAFSFSRSIADSTRLGCDRC
jgi:hypothetical protein